MSLPECYVILSDDLITPMKSPPDDATLTNCHITRLTSLPDETCSRYTDDVT